MSDEEKDMLMDMVGISPNESVNAQYYRYEAPEYNAKPIAKWRKAKGITQEQLGKKVGLGKSGISKIENGITHISAEEAQSHYAPCAHFCNQGV